MASLSQITWTSLETEEYIADSFLFQCANTFNWHTLNDYCSKVLIALALDKQTKMKLNAQANSKSQCLARRLYRQLTYTDQWGNTPLHSACFNKPPACVIYHLLAASKHTSPPLFPHRSLPLHRSRDGSTPLLIACATGSEVDVIHGLLDHVQENGSSSRFKGNMGMHRAQWLACKADISSSTPLSELCTYYHTTRKYRSYSNGDQHDSINGSNAHGSALPTPPLLMEVSSWDQVCSNPSLIRFWNKTRLVLAAAIRFPISPSSPDNDEHYNKNRNDRFVLDAIATMPHICPRPLLEMVCRLYSTQFLRCGTIDLYDYSGMEDMNGGAASQGDASYYDYYQRTPLLPLHRAILTPKALLLKPLLNLHWDSVTCEGNKQEKLECRLQTKLRMEVNRGETLKQFLSVYPNAARKAVPIPQYGKDGWNWKMNVHWRSPLCAAIASGFHWDTPPLQHHGYSKIEVYTNKKGSDGPLKMLWKETPEAVEVRDLVTGLYPFMLAAITASRSSATTNSKENNDNDLSRGSNMESCLRIGTIFNLLRCCPTLVMNPSGAILDDAFA